MRDFAVLSLLLLLGGCQNILTEQAPVVPVPVVKAVAKPITKPVVKPVRKPRFVIATIMGLAPETIQNILGTASLIRKEKNARVWLYKNQECRLHLYFYPNDNGDFRLDYIETAAVNSSTKATTKGHGLSPNACLDSLIIPANPPPSSADIGTDPQPDR
ncbi:MAG: hypothetical protein GXP02_06760 [Alphaproteobacteria bacterium]|nr:hypothetical protein [Alphaproteobacteria bacterium]